ncbi:hypothetical protein DCAR_0100286 [Daucus carota subsp. sativus]|uniref:Uncharacterized protein n=1 Tax=Daucus carota subsp. sativus TaxID=79200 RepID=A0A166ECE9_DAUCS|nr:hypothetical protein DCAR_0100286 [Daucus carota subsp. sativus]
MHKKRNFEYKKHITKTHNKLIKINRKTMKRLYLDHDQTYKSTYKVSRWIYGQNLDKSK